MNRAVLGLALWLCGALLRAGTVEISFLEDATAVQDTTEFLRAQGCRSDAIAAFRQAVLRYREHPLELDRTEFPTRKMGFYSFASASNLVAALTHPLYDSAHPYELNCFDSAILLTKDLLHVRVQPDELAGPFLPAFTWTNHLTYWYVAATARDAFSDTYPSWYTDVTKDIMGASTNETRMCLVTAFDCWHVLPGSGSDGSVGNGLLKVLQHDWEKQRLIFPTNIEVVLCHQLSPSEGRAVTEHAGLLFHDRKHYVYIEKAGGSGPFVRLDFNDLAELPTWLAAPHAGETNTTNQYFATFNDKRIEVLKVRFK